MKYNTAGQEFHAIAFNASGRVSGDAANITCTLALDGGTRAATNDVNPTEIGTTGEYVFTLTQAESLGHQQSFAPVSSTPGVQVLGVPSNVIYTTQETAIKAKTDLLGTTAGDSIASSSESIYATVGSTRSVSVICNQDVSSLTLSVTVETKNKTAVDTVVNGSITKSDTIATFALTSGMTSVERTLRVLIKNTANGETVASPLLFVSYDA